MTRPSVLENSGPIEELNVRKAGFEFLVESVREICLSCDE